MRNKSKKLSRILAGVTGILGSLLLMLCINVIRVSAVDNYPLLNIGMNDSLSINQDFGNYYAYVRFCPPKTGAITFSITADRKFFETVMLMKQNSSGAYVPALSDNESDAIENINGNGGASRVTYAVKKGVKYALRVDLNDDFILNSSFKKVADTGGKKKSSAKTLKKGKTQYGLLPIGKRKSRWYKFKVPSSKPLTFQFKGMGNAWMNYQVKVKGMETISRSVYQNNWENKKGDPSKRENNKTKVMKAQLKKGSIVYVRVYTDSKHDTGYYMLKWK